MTTGQDGGYRLRGLTGTQIERLSGSPTSQADV